MRWWAAVLAAVLAGGGLHAQTAQLRPLHVSAQGSILDDTGKPMLLRGVNRSGTGSGNAEGGATDAEYAAQGQLLGANLVRILVNAVWWTSNVQVPLANQKYQDYIDALIQRSKKYGSYVLIVKAGQFPDLPCGADGKNCPAPNQGDLNCQANSSVCAAQDTSGTTIDAALPFWSAFAKRYAADQAMLYDTWENMSVTDLDAWSNNQNQLIATIRTYNAQALVFVEDGGTAYEAIAADTIPDLAWPNLVWTFHLYNASVAGCTEPASPRYANWPQNLTPVVNFAQMQGHAAAITEWGGCNDSEPYHTNITSFAKTRGVALGYFDSGNLLTLSGSTWQLTSTGTKVAQAYAAIASGSTAPGIALVANAEGEVPLIAPNTWVEVKGTNLAPAGDTRIWQGSDFFGGQLPTQLDGVSVTVNGKAAFVYYVSPQQINILTPPDAMQGMVRIQVTSAGVASASVNVEAQAVAPAFFVFNGGPQVAAEHADGSLLGSATLYPGLTTPAKPGETVVLFANGFGPTSVPVVSGSSAQSGTLPALPAIKIGGVTATVQFAGLIGPGEFQFNVVVPGTLADGDQPIAATYSGASTQAGTVITVKK
jgi:uncharacterized protein (TIGR03437 family)